MRNVRRLSIVGIIILLALVVAPSAFAGVDDYPAPWRAPTPMDHMLDSWGQWNRECTSFCAWRLHSRNGFEIPWAFGYATTWGTHAASLGPLSHLVGLIRPVEVPHSVGGEDDCNEG